MKLFLLGVPVPYSNPGVTVHFSQVPHLPTFTFGGVVFSESNARTFVIVFVLFFLEILALYPADGLKCWMRQS